jgi:hypothetical protein
MEQDRAHESACRLHNLLRRAFSDFSRNLTPPKITRQRYMYRTLAKEGPLRNISPPPLLAQFPVEV